MLLFLKVQFINSGVMSTPLAKGSAVVNRMAVLAFPILLLNVTVSNLKKKKMLGLQTPSCRELELGASCTGGKKQTKASQGREELFSSDPSVLFKYAQICFQCQKSSSLSQSNRKIPSP